MISGWNAAKKEEKYVNVFLILDASWTHSKKKKKSDLAESIQTN
uniref:Uncharacterized protein n=1 Tax=Anguilla anguilla TaxID=7936 RepID=A0A0E9WPA9_ANGAN